MSEAASPMGANPYPVRFSVERPSRYQRVQLLLRIGVWIVLSWLGNFGLGLALLVAPVISAVLINQKGGASFLERHRAAYQKILSFYMGVMAYLWFTTDTFPTWGEDGPSTLSITTSGTPTVGSALLRFIMVIPQVIVLSLVGFVAMLLGVVAFFSVLINQSVPSRICDFETAFLAWQARVLTYFVSLVEEYPPYSFSTLTESQAPPPAA